MAVAECWVPNHQFGKNEYPAESALLSFEDSFPWNPTTCR